jgi:hypothetical protein
MKIKERFAMDIRLLEFIYHLKFKEDFMHELQVSSKEGKLKVMEITTRDEDDLKFIRKLFLRSKVAKLWEPQRYLEETTIHFRYELPVNYCIKPNHAKIV